MCLILIPVGVVYADEVQISIDDINAEGGQTVEVPIILSGNTGICGANINIFYDKNLKLIDITKVYHCMGCNGERFNEWYYSCFKICDSKC